MPQATTRTLSLRLGLVSAITSVLFGALTGIATADTTAPAPSDPGSSSSPSAGDPSSPSQPDPSTGDSGSTNPTITYATPRAAVDGHSAHMRSARERHSLEVRAVLHEAWEQRGKPYSYGGSGPSVFDCSGLVRYVFGHAVGRWLPHNAAAQYQSVMHIKRRDLQPGDLVFQESGGYPFHVGIYAGHGMWWHAPHTGTVVQKQKIYSGHKYYGRILTNGFAERHPGHPNH